MKRAAEDYSGCGDLVQGWVQVAASVGLTSAIALCATLVLLPTALVMYSLVSRARAAWLGVLERRYPQLEFVRNTTVRTAVDTHRNQGVIALLLTVQGTCNPTDIKARLQSDIVDRRWPEGGLRFPHLRTPLTQRWGRYAWKRNAGHDFQLDRQLVVCSAAYRGRPVADNNIQEVVSDLVAKYLAPELPPWQVALIPSAERYFVLIRVHHLLLSEDGLKLTDVLQFTRSDHPSTVASKPAGHLLQGILEPPVALPALYERLGESVANHWNEIIAQYDPLENPKVLRAPSVLGLSVALLIAVVSAVPEAMSAGWTGWYPAVLAQARRRGLGGEAWGAALQRLVAPHAWLSSLLMMGYRLMGLWGALAGMALRILLAAVLELASAAKHRTRYTASLMARSPYLLLWWNSILEAARLTRVAVRSPRLLVEDLFLSHRHQPLHHFQTVSLCGRKVVAWSDPFPQDVIQRIAQAAGASSSEVCLSALCGALREYFRSHGLPVPGAVLTTARYCPLEELVGGATGTEDCCGLVCLALPVADAAKDPLLLVQEVRERMRVVRERQAGLWVVSSWQGLLTRVVPQLLVRLHLNYLSRRFAVALTEVSAQHLDYPAGLLWGQPLVSLMYWRPPQANVSLSLSLLTVDSLVSLGVMADAQLSPQHGAIARAWTQHLRDLARAAGLAV